MESLIVARGQIADACRTAGTFAPAVLERGYLVEQEATIRVALTAALSTAKVP